MLEKIKNKVDAIALSGSIAAMTVFNSVSAFAVDGTGTTVDTSAITNAVSSGITDARTQFMAIAGTAIIGAMGFFAIKFGAIQGIGFFANLAKK